MLSLLTLDGLVASDLSNSWDVIPFLDTCLLPLSFHTEALGPVKVQWELSPGAETCSGLPLTLSMRFCLANPPEFLTA